MHLQDGDNSTCVRRGLLRERRQCLVDGIPLHMFAVTIVIFFFFGFAYRFPEASDGVIFTILLGTVFRNFMGIKCVYSHIIPIRAM